MSRIALLVSIPIEEGLQEDIACGRSPRKDYFALAEELNADIIQHERVISRLSHTASKTALGSSLAQAWYAFQRRHDYDLILTDSEHVGLLLASLFKLSRTRKAHVMIAHHLSPLKKAFFLRVLRVHSHIDKIICYGSAQRDIAINKLKIPSHKVELVLHPTDQNFWHPLPRQQDRIISSAGLELRDYPTLMKAVDGLDVKLMLLAASPWSRRKNETEQVKIPDNVELLGNRSRQELRDIYARSLFVVVPLYETDFQAGTQVMYEAMAMGKAIVASRTTGQGDILEEGVTGLYVPPGDVTALRKALLYLLDNPDEAQRMGANAREAVEEKLNLDAYVNRVQEIVSQVNGTSRLNIGEEGQC